VASDPSYDSCESNARGQLGEGKHRFNYCISDHGFPSAASLAI